MTDLNPTVHASANRTFAHLVVLFLLYPPAFSIAFAVVGLPIPAYLFCTVLGVLILLTTTRFSLRIFPSFNRQSVTAGMLLLLIYCSSAYTVSPSAWLDKVIFITYTITVPVCVMSAAFIFRRRSAETLRTLESALYRHAVPMLWMSSIVLLVFGTNANEDGRLALPGIENTIWVSRYFGTLSVVVFCSACRRGWRQPVQLSSLILAMLDMLAIGSRAPLLALLAVLITYQYRRGGKASASLLIVGVTSLLVIAYFTIGGYVFETGFYSLYERLDILSAFVDFSGFPIAGFGVGSFGIITTGMDFLFYPHNLLAEVFFEQGVLGLALLLVLVWILVRNFRFDIRGYLLIFTFINSLGSGDIPSNNVFFMLIFLTALPLTIKQGGALTKKTGDEHGKGTVA